jgi:hypothetical protein
MVSTVYVRKLFSSASIPWFLESFGICIRSKIDQKSSAPCFFFLADEQTPELVIVDQSLGREDVASGSATNFVCSPATRLSLSLSPDSNPLPRSSHVSPPSPPSASGRSERDAPPTVAHDPDARARPRRPKDGARRRHPSCGWQVDGPQAEVPYSSLYRGWASYPRSRTRGVGRSRQRTGDVAGPVQRRVSGRRRMCAACQCCFSWGRSWLCWVLLTITSLAKKGDYN